MQPITLYWRPQVPNPSKIVIIFEELGIPYVGKFIEHADLKQPAFEAINPNGRVPAIHDPNTDLTLWESGAIVSYLIEKYDTEHKLSYVTEPEKYHVLQWQHYQSTGQGPYWGQAAWFQLFHQEPLESAKKRYVDEAIRIVKVLDKWLAGRDWLVGDKCTYADLAYVSWNAAIPLFMQGRSEWNMDDYPNFKRWNEAMMGRASVMKALSMAKEEDVKG
ncbi:Uncharacterized protein BP5553_07701 [Venustampulla echinocandica]|uniref:Glutathione S-transferase n=1 Tax=Venustampulla echinocandica TaxID=2656787 RepID=A0A370THA6_9HELO|nr:Uncharacterized protein BP5553_07701 [Venustampulla echinocandica]RDL34573.1 Uncharacterized protein BP5553_07701 [Venustampulla echinocandica]